MNMTTTTTTTTTTWNPPPPPPPLNSLHSHILSALNHHLPGHHNQVQVQQQPSTCSRWNPTAEQLLALEELYRRGMRTPTATQIHQIATRLRRFGKIEGKNVFYWFQNHKARERQKRRRLVDTNSTNNHQHNNNNNNNNHINSNNNTPKNLENHHDSVLMRREGYKVEQTGSRVRSLNCSKSSEIQRNEMWELGSSAICCSTTSPTTVSVCKTKSHDVNEKVGDEETAGGDDQTLELFPVKGINARKRDTNRFPSRCTPNYQYIEFLPVKK